LLARVNKKPRRDENDAVFCWSVVMAQIVLLCSSFVNSFPHPPQNLAPKSARCPQEAHSFITIKRYDVVFRVFMGRVGCSSMSVRGGSVVVLGLLGKVKNDGNASIT
jgi:hypothetical protein